MTVDTGQQINTCNSCYSSGVAKGVQRAQAPQLSRQNISIRINCTKFANLVSFNFGKIIKIVAIKSHLLKLKCAKFDFGWGSVPDPVGGTQRSPDILARILRGFTSK